MDRDRRPARAAHAGVPPEDDIAVSRARRRLRAEGAIPIEPDQQIAVMLDPDERVVTMRRGVSVDRRTANARSGAGLPGDLYVTDRRLVHIGRICLDVPLETIREAVVAGNRVHLFVGDGRGITIEVEDPGLLRVEIAAARAARRAISGPERKS